MDPPTAANVLFTGESAAPELLSWLDAIAEITRASNRCGPLDELLDLIAGATARLTRYDFCGVFVADAASQRLVIQGSYGLSRQYIDTLNAGTPVPIRAGDAGESTSSRAFRAQRPTTVRDIHADAPSRRWESLAALQGYSSMVSVPVVVSGEAFGVLNCYTVKLHDFAPREIIMLESMANQAGLAIEMQRRLVRAEERTDAASAEAARLRRALEAQLVADENHRELLRVVLRGGGLSAIAESLAAMLHCTVAIDDAAGRLLASARSDGRPGARDRRVVAAHEHARAKVGGDVGGELVAVPSEQDGTEGLVVPVMLDEEAAGQLWALDPRSLLGPPQRQALTRAAAVVALALLKERATQEVEWRLSRDFLDDLFDPAGQAGETLRARARQLGADLSRPHAVLVVRRDPASDGSGAVQEDREAYAQRSLLSLVQQTGAATGGATLTATRSDHVVVLWDEAALNHSALDFAEHLLREIQAYASGWTATISVGPSCDDIREYGDAYRLSCGVLDLAQQADRRDRVVSLDSIGAYRLLLQVKRPQELQSFAESTLGTVHNYDQQHRTPLAATLHCYMTHRCNVSATARMLHVHPNTVAYRLRRIEELLEVDMGDPQVLLHLQLALMIEAILGD